MAGDRFADLSIENLSAVDPSSLLESRIYSDGYDALWSLAWHGHRWLVVIAAG